MINWKKLSISELFSERHSLERSLKNRFEETEVLKTMNKKLQEEVTSKNVQLSKAKKEGKSKEK